MTRGMTNANLLATGLALIGGTILASVSQAAAQSLPADPNQGRTGVRVEQQGEGAGSTAQAVTDVIGTTLASRNQAARDSAINTDPRRRIENRIENRIESRLGTRVDRNSVTGATTPPRPSGRPRG